MDQRFVEEHGVGVVCAGGDAESLAAGVARALDRRQDFASRLADPKLLDLLSWERQSDVLLAVYEQLWSVAHA